MIKLFSYYKKKQIQIILIILVSFSFFSAALYAKNVSAWMKTTLLALEINAKQDKTLPTWLENGVRDIYNRYHSKIDLQILEQVLGTKLYLRGPHKNKINVKSKYSFGHYNPAAVKKIKIMTMKLLKNKSFVALFQSFYNVHLKKLVRAYARSYVFTIQNKKKFKTEIRFYSKMLKSKLLPRWYEFSTKLDRKFAEKAEKKGLNFYFHFTALHFWQRRYLDNTHKEFFRIIKLVLKSFDEEFYVQLMLKNKVKK